MTFADLVDEVADRLNLSSDKAIARVGRSVNERYRSLASSIGLPEVARQTITANSVIGSANVTFTAQKLYSVFNTATTPSTVLDQYSFDTMRNMLNVADPPTSFAVQSLTSSTVTILMNVTAATIYPLSADADVNLVTLSGTMVPAFAENFHDCLVYGAMSIELEKQEKYDLSSAQDAKYQTRVSELRLYNAKNAYTRFYQGANTNTGYFYN